VTVYLAAASLSTTNAALLRACRRAGEHAVQVPPRVAARDARPVDRVLARLDVRGSLDGIEDGLWELEQLAERGVTLLNSPSALLAAHDKLATAVKLGQAGIPHPRTAHIDDETSELELEFPVVVRPRFGSSGKDVFPCHDRHELRRSIQAIRKRSWFLRQGALVQELVPSPQHDLRLVVASGEVTGAIERWALPGERRPNVARAKRRRAAPPAEARALAVAAADAIGADLVGVDLDRSQDGSWSVRQLDAAVTFTPADGLEGRDPFDESIRALGLAARHRGHALHAATLEALA
jgi:[lysine-biosynthesis-protein LysW]--L-2-aminoadipate ligase